MHASFLHPGFSPLFCFVFLHAGSIADTWSCKQE